MDDVNIASIIATTYEQHIDNNIENYYGAHVYNMPSNIETEFESVINQRSEISKMMVSISSVTKSDTPYEFFSDPIIGQLEELEGRIYNIFGPEAVAQVKPKIIAVHVTRGNGFNKNNFSKIWVVSE